MKTIATNVRFSKDDYEEIKRLAYLSDMSVASFIRKSIDLYKENVLISKSKKKALFERIVESAVKIDTSTVDLAKSGRKYE